MTEKKIGGNEEEVKLKQILVTFTISNNQKLLCIIFLTALYKFIFQHISLSY